MAQRPVPELLNWGKLGLRTTYPARGYWIRNVGDNLDRWPGRRGNDLAGSPHAPLSAGPKEVLSSVCDSTTQAVLGDLSSHQ